MNRALVLGVLLMGCSRSPVAPLDAELECIDGVVLVEGPAEVVTCGPGVLNATMLQGSATITWDDQGCLHVGVWSGDAAIEFHDVAGYPMCPETLGLGEAQ